MGIFNIGKAKPKTTKPQKQDTFQKNLRKYVIPYSKGFRGFKIFPVVVHGNKETEQINEHMYNKDISNSIIEFVCFNYNEHDRMAQIHIDGKNVGAIFNDDQLYAIENNLIEKIHAEPHEDISIGKHSTITTHRFRWLVKYKSQESITTP